jgi:RNA polymerase sigma-70 factor (ECF subfamily)
VSNQTESEAPAARFERVVMPHLDAAFSLARWLAGNAHDAEDIAQESYLRAYRAFHTVHGGNVRPWLLSIIRNTCYTWLKRNRARAPKAISDDELDDLATGAFDPQAELLRLDDEETVTRTMDQLPPEYREVIVLRELQELSYRQIAEIVQIPIGTVMSRLARARNQLERLMLATAEEV